MTENANEVGTLRIVHDPDHDGCMSCPLSSLHGDMDDTLLCDATKQRVMVLDEPPAAPSWCPLRAGDVLVSARKDSGK